MKAKPIHVFSQVKSITRKPLYPKLAILDYWNSKRRTEIHLVDLVSVEGECEDLIVTVKSDKIRTYTKRTKKEKE
jgi:hypothetical protein